MQSEHFHAFQNQQGIGKAAEQFEQSTILPKQTLLFEVDPVLKGA